ncbi:MAG: hypothetical protein ACYTEO_03245 [Planctomycetota bacterium]|jgi:hypothetical protein
MFFPTFGILAPLTLQWTALEEHRRADTRAVMYCVLLDVEYASSYLAFGLVPPMADRRNMF